MPLPPATLYKAWTTEFDRWFAVPGSVLMTAKVDTPFFFETEFRPASDTALQRHPHYGRFLQLIPNGTWTLVRLSHAGFPDIESMERHRQAWPMVLEQLEQRYAR
jgi:hypothetical protein